MAADSGGKKCQITITGPELTELKRFTWAMTDAGDLDKRLEAYQGETPLELGSWDLACLADVTSMALDDVEEYPDSSAAGYEALRSLQARIKKLKI